MGDLVDCWEWTGARDPNGYGRVNWQGKSMLAHRVAYMLMTISGTLDDRHILHACDNPPCCNPIHLWPGTAADNTADMFKKGRQQSYRRKTHCIHGHEYTEENTLWVKTAAGYMARQCRICGRRKAMEYHWKNRDAMLPKMRVRTAAWKLARKDTGK
jgi:hypothetical protein